MLLFQNVVHANRDAMIVEMTGWLMYDLSLVMKQTVVRMCGTLE